MIETIEFDVDSQDHDYEALSYTGDLLTNFGPYPLMAGLDMSEKISGGHFITCARKVRSDVFGLTLYASIKQI